MPPPPPLAPKLVVEELQIVTVTTKATRSLLNPKGPRGKGKQPTIRAYLTGPRVSRVCHTKFGNEVPKVAVVSLYYNEVLAGHRGKAVPKSFKDVKIYILETPTVSKQVGSTGKTATLNKVTTTVIPTSLRKNSEQIEVATPKKLPATHDYATPEIIPKNDQARGNKIARGNTKAHGNQMGHDTKIGRGTKVAHGDNQACGTKISLDYNVHHCNKKRSQQCPPSRGRDCSRQQQSLWPQNSSRQDGACA